MEIGLTDDESAVGELLIFCVGVLARSIGGLLLVVAVAVAAAEEAATACGSVPKAA